MTIAGSDSGGGAGIQADLKTFAAMGVHGTVALTAITAQNTVAVTKVHEIPLDVIEAQIDAVASDIGIDAAKTGMLSSKEIIKTVASKVKQYGFPLVVDPVMIAKSGAPLLRSDAISTLIETLLPLATVVTPNKHEAELLSNMKIASLDDAIEAAKRISQKGVKAVIVKGGHLEEAEATDVLYLDGRVELFKTPRVDTTTTHGTGCSFSAAITAGLAKGLEIVEAVKEAKQLIYKAIKYGLPIGAGHGPVNPSAYADIDAEKFRVLKLLLEAVNEIESSSELTRLAPESQINLAYSLPLKYAREIADVAAIPGRIVKVGDKLKASACPSFGASSHVARAILTAMKFNPEIRAAMNVKFSPEIIDACKRAGLTISSYDRREEPPDVKAKEGATIPWGVETAVKKAGFVPDIVYHEGDWGKEPMTLIFGKTPAEVVNKAKLIANKLT